MHAIDSLQVFFVIFCVQDEEDYDVMQDPDFLQSVLENLPGVDPNNEAIRNAMGSLASQTGPKPDQKKDEEKKKWAPEEQTSMCQIKTRIALHVFIHRTIVPHRTILFILLFV